MTTTICPTFSPLTSHKVSGLRGVIDVPGDKSLSHRSLILGTIADGTSIIRGLLESDDVMATKSAMTSLGATIDWVDCEYHISGVGNGCLLCPTSSLDFGNSGTGCRLTMGLVSSYDFATTFVGDSSLSSRPMDRVLSPLRQMGLQLREDSSDRLPLTMSGSPLPVPITYTLPVASAQVKSAILLAGLNVSGITSVIESFPTRDHTERMLSGFGADIDIRQEGSTRHISVRGHCRLRPQEIDIAGDPSSAAFATVAALIVPDSEITIRNVLLNPTRIGLYDVLIEMGANIEFLNPRDLCGEPVGDIRVRSSSLRGVEVSADRSASLIDEYPILSVAASYAMGESRFFGLSELRLKESDRLSAIAQGLLLSGVDCEEGEDSLMVRGCGDSAVKGGDGGEEVRTHLDHRIAMSFIVLGMGSEYPVRVDDTSMISTSFPNFCDLMISLGARFDVN